MGNNNGGRQANKKPGAKTTPGKGTQGHKGRTTETSKEETREKSKTPRTSEIDTKVEAPGTNRTGADFQKEVQK